MRPRERRSAAPSPSAAPRDIRADPVAGVVALAGNLLALGQDRLGLADLENDVALLDPGGRCRGGSALPCRRTPNRSPRARPSLTFWRMTCLAVCAAIRPRSWAALLLDLELDVQIASALASRLREADLGLRVGDLLDDPLAEERRELARLSSISIGRYRAGVRLPAGGLQGRLTVQRGSPFRSLSVRSAHNAESTLGS